MKIIGLGYQMMLLGNNKDLLLSVPLKIRSPELPSDATKNHRYWNSNLLY